MDTAPSLMSSSFISPFENIYLDSMNLAKTCKPHENELLCLCFHVLPRGVVESSRKSRYDGAAMWTGFVLATWLRWVMSNSHRLSAVADRWAWAVCHPCRQHLPAAARCVAQIPMTCTPTSPAQCPLPAPAPPHQTTPARSEGLCATDRRTAETRTGVSMWSKHTTLAGSLLRNSTTQDGSFHVGQCANQSLKGHKQIGGHMSHFDGGWNYLNIISSL